MNESNVGGKFDQLTGKVKQGVGEALGNEKLADEGAADEVKGHAKETWGNVKDTASDISDSAHANVDSEAANSGAHAEHAGSTLREDITNAAEHAKDSISRGLDHLKGK